MTKQEVFDTWAVVTIALALGCGLMVGAGVTGHIETEEYWDVVLGIGSGITTTGVICGLSLIKFYAVDRGT